MQASRGVRAGDAADTPAASRGPAVCRLMGGYQPRAAAPAPARAAHLPQKVFASIVKHAPLVAIDLIVQNERGEVLLGLRRNAPARGFWFVPGGRMLKDERIASAVARVVHDELAVDARLHRAILLGVFEHLYEDNFTRAAGFGTHYLVLAHRMTMTTAQASMLPRQQHAGYRWLPVRELAHAGDVHPYSRDYASHL